MMRCENKFAVVRRYLSGLAAICVIFGLYSCKGSEQTSVELKSAGNQQTQVGESWHVIEENDVESMWINTKEPVIDTELVLFETPAIETGHEGQSDTLEISIKSDDRVFVTRRDTSGKVACHYAGRIWVETDLESYNVFNEAIESSDQPVFHRLVKGTYRCSEQGEVKAWLAKING